MPEDRRQTAGTTTPAVAGRVVVVGNLKGGSGKSTLVMNLAGALAEKGRTIAILDCDPQGTATSWADRGGPVRVRFEPLKNLNGAGGWLATASAMRREVDILIVDLPAVVAPAMGAAFMIADVILIPVAPQAVDMEGSRRVLAHLETARAERRTGTPPKALLVPSRVREMERGLERWETMLEPMGLPSTTPLRHHIGYDRAFERGQWVGQAFPGGGAHREVTAIAERVLAELGLAAVPAAATPPAAAPAPARAAAPEPAAPVAPTRATSKPAAAAPAGQPRPARAPVLAEARPGYVPPPPQARRSPPPPRRSWIQRWFGD